MYENNISTVDGRYYDELAKIRGLLTEKELFRNRIYVELKYLQWLIDFKALDIKAGTINVEEIMKLMEKSWYKRVKRLESSVKHDVKATELYVRELLEKAGRDDISPFVHLGLTSEDVNSNAFGIMYLSALKQIAKAYGELAFKLAEISNKHASTPMLARTHGVPAVPTTFGKEMSIFALRISKMTRKACELAPYGKLSGAVGAYNAMHFLDPDFDWISFAKNFVEGLGLRFIVTTKQTAPVDALSDSLHYIIQLNYVIQELSRDLWMYNMLGLIKFERKGVSSSTMPHKVNPVDLEDAEGQAKMSNSILMIVAYDTIPTRMDRDLSDSTIRRNLWQGLSHSFIAANRLIKSINYMVVNAEIMKAEAMAHQESLSEAVQVSLRAQGNRMGYEEVMHGLDKLDSLKDHVTGELGMRLRQLTPANYTGLAEKQALLASREAIAELNDLKCL